MEIEDVDAVRASRVARLVVAMQKFPYFLVSAASL
jgi:hypothetical protein